MINLIEHLIKWHILKNRGFSWLRIKVAFYHFFVNLAKIKLDFDYTEKEKLQAIKKLENEGYIKCKFVDLSQ